MSAVLVFFAVVSLVGLGASTASAAPPPPPIAVLPHPPLIAATFTLNPDSGPVGTQVTIKGWCGYAAGGVLYAVRVQTADGLQTIWLPPEFAKLKKTGPIGFFSVTFTFPSVGNTGVFAGVAITPGTYYVFAGCNDPIFTLMPTEPFTVTA